MGSSINVEQRFANHKCELKKGTHYCQKLQIEFTKHGESCFQFLLLESCTERLLMRTEQVWISTFLEPL